MGDETPAALLAYSVGPKAAQKIEVEIKNMPDHHFSVFLESVFPLYLSFAVSSGIFLPLTPSFPPPFAWDRVFL